ncbi:hypothetical protein CBA19CS22_02650 [Caballeronia novacaledonica]|uniref:Uncharacterized protein n=1 Tax=Caballeronia novacaledonica TaxID=1544861 RepID=A0ACB5QL42_9BURK|nr:hypothetical protein CBA19CS22_02650 [Caballeronia novacaledonica]
MVSIWHPVSSFAPYLESPLRAGFCIALFPEKSTDSIATPKPDIDIVRARLKAAQDHAAGERNDRD